MIKETQQLLIIVLGVIAVLCILKEYQATTILATIVGILGGFLTGRKFIVDPTEQRILSEGDGDVQ